MKHALSAFSIAFLLAILTSQLWAQPYVINRDALFESGFRSSTIIQGLEHPWSMAWLPNGDMLITERPGRLRRIKDDRLMAAPISGIPEVFASGQGGLLDISLHPQFEDNRTLYFTYAHGGLTANRTRVARAILRGDSYNLTQAAFAVLRLFADPVVF